jgi:hypothetical protein
MNPPECDRRVFGFLASIIRQGGCESRHFDRMGLFPSKEKLNDRLQLASSNARLRGVKEHTAKEV